ncbi:hypothetical protein BD410DRAFT_743382 [Rickenella mellea]|uniref:Cytoplasmic tRNA 2-thiolation protein 2 n=1 Tax=Rickenella mellea TaxID=50990 RepID=A0A4Y7QE08_9AGAM|nr:hypothetical protein BD410DRAFT_743382 [Rickenella mellea]
MPRKSKFDKSKTCIKCKTARGNIVIRHAVYCKTCFTPLVVTKYKRCLDPHINAAPDGQRRSTLKASGNLLIGLSGGLGSTVLLDITSRCYFSTKSSTEDGRKGGKAHPKNDRVWKQASVCFVDTSRAFSEGVTKDRSEDIRAMVEQHKEFEFIVLRLEDAFDISWWKQLGGYVPSSDIRANLANEDLVITEAHLQSSDPVASLRSYLSSLPTATAVRSSINTLARLLLLHTARSMQCSHLLLGTSLTSLSISLINSIAQGGGFNVLEESFEEWTPQIARSAQDASSDSPHLAGGVCTVRVVRPLRDIGMKECAAWAWWNGLQVVGKDRTFDPDGKQTIGGLTKDFIVGLERDYPSTVSTIARTCAKLAPKNEPDGQCIVCERPAQRGIQDWKSRISIRSLEPPSPHPPHVASDDPPPISLTPHLCYACHTTLISRSSRSTVQNGAEASLAPLPVWTRSALVESDAADVMGTKRLVDHEDMRNAIGEFLLHD